MIKFLIFLIAGILCLNTVFSRALTRIVKRNIVDKDSKSPVPGVHV